MASEIQSPVETPVVTPTPASTPWPERYTNPIHICPQQRREMTSPDVAP